MSHLRYCLIVTLCAVVFPAHASDPEARAWLERMSRALSSQNYDGRFFHLRQNKSESMRIIHRVDKGKITERLVKAGYTEAQLANFWSGNALRVLGKAHEARKQV